MRRTPVPLSVAIIVLVALLAAGHVQWSVAQEDTPPAALPAPLDELMAAWNAHDPQRIVALYTEDAVVAEMIVGDPVYRGPEEITAWVEANIAAFPDLWFEIGRVVGTGDLVAVEWVYNGTYTGELEGLPPGDGQTFSVPGITVWELREGQIVQETLYYDLYLFLLQLGVVPVPGPPPAVATPPA